MRIAQRAVEVEDVPDVLAVGLARDVEEAVAISLYGVDAGVDGGDTGLSRVLVVETRRKEGREVVERTLDGVLSSFRRSSTSSWILVKRSSTSIWGEHEGRKQRHVNHGSHHG